MQFYSLIWECVLILLSSDIASSSPIEEDSEESSCIQCLCMHSKNKSLKEFLTAADGSSSQQKKQDIPQFYNKQQRQEKNEEGNVNTMNLFYCMKLIVFSSLQYSFDVANIKTIFLINNSSELTVFNTSVD